MTSPETITVPFDTRLTIAEVADCYVRLLALLLDGKPLIMDLQAITRIDTAGLQLLCCFAAEAKRLQIMLNWQPLPASVQQALDVAGIDLTGNAAANTESPWQSF